MSYTPKKSIHKVALIEDRKQADGGASTVNGFHTRELNTASGDIAAVGITLTNGTTGIGGTNNEVTLTYAGRYKITWVCPGNITDWHQSQLYNQTTSSIIKEGRSAYNTPTTTTVTTDSTGEWVGELPAGTALRLKHFITSAHASGLGASSYSKHANNTNTYDIYSTMEITRLD